MTGESVDAVLIESVLAARRRERERLSRLLHDDIGQILTATGLELDLFGLDFAQKDPEMGSRVSGIQTILEQAFVKVRALSHELHPDPVRRFGFLPSLERLTESARRGYRGEFDVELDGTVRTGDEAAIALYEAAGAALDNAILHSKGSRIWITLTVEERVTLTVGDNGIGFDPAGVDKGLGLRLFDYYSQAGILRFSLQSGVPRGTIVTFRSDKVT